MGMITQEMIKQFSSLMEEIDEPLKNSFKSIHEGYPTENLVRFLKAREGNVSKAHKMMVDSLNWRVQNEIDNILAKPIIPTDLYRAVRDSYLIGMSGYSKEGLPIIAIGVGLSTYDKASVQYYVQSHIQMNEYRDRVILPCATKKYGRYISTCVKILDMTGLKLSALNQIKLLTVLSTIDDLNYPEKTDTYYIVNAPYIFSACWKVVKPLLQERTRKKVQVLAGCGRDELLNRNLDLRNPQAGMRQYHCLTNSSDTFELVILQTKFRQYIFANPTPLLYTIKVKSCMILSVLYHLCPGFIVSCKRYVGYVGVFFIIFVLVLISETLLLSIILLLALTTITGDLNADNGLLISPTFL
ncbi:unnamed protein product [Ilex paraguariensis]|uniref:CRAL-TRIO domain-containing protein n=1 Tax=Ilex paraguariensis TaxID=185542 RepID=A0ABC8RJG6_9AQUA